MCACCVCLAVLSGVALSSWSSCDMPVCCCSGAEDECWWCTCGVLVSVWVPVLAALSGEGVTGSSVGCCNCCTSICCTCSTPAARSSWFIRSSSKESRCALLVAVGACAIWQATCSTADDTSACADTLIEWHSTSACVTGDASPSTCRATRSIRGKEYPKQNAMHVKLINQPSLETRPWDLLGVALPDPDACCDPEEPLVLLLWLDWTIDVEAVVADVSFSSSSSTAGACCCTAGLVLIASASCVRYPVRSLTTPAAKPAQPMLTLRSIWLKLIDMFQLSV